MDREDIIEWIGIIKENTATQKEVLLMQRRANDLLAETIGDLLHTHMLTERVEAQLSDTERGFREHLDLYLSINRELGKSIEIFSSKFEEGKKLFNLLSRIKRRETLINKGDD